MPYKPKKPCSYPGCPALVESGSRCEKHKRDRQYDRDYDRTRGTAHQRGYGVNWQRLRKMVLGAEPLCRHCKKEGVINPAQEVDHIDGNAYNLEWSNLQPLCKSCHSKKTIKEQGAGWKKKA